MEIWWSAPGELPEEAAEIRREIFMQEQGFQDEFDALDGESLHALLLDDGKAIGTARMFPDGDGVMHVGRVAVRKQRRGTGAGAQLLEACCEKAQALGCRRIILGAQCRAENFYKKSGFQSYGAVFDDEGCPHQMMEKQL